MSQRALVCSIRRTSIFGYFHRQKLLWWCSVVFFLFRGYFSQGAFASAQTHQNAKSLSCEQSLQTAAAQVSLASLLWHFVLAKGNPHDLFAQLELRYGKANMRIQIPIINRALHVYQTKEEVAQVLKHKSKLPYVNENFDHSHGHFDSINSVNTDEPLWHTLHYGLLEIFSKKKISPIMERHKHILFQNEVTNLNETLEQYFLAVWAEYMFGPVNGDEFAAMRHELIATLGKAFHQNPLNRIPVLGKLTSRINGYRFGSKWKEIDANLARLLNTSITAKEGAFYELHERIRADFPQYSPERVHQITVDNSFLGILVYDFIHIILLDATVHFAKYPELDRKQQVNRSLHSSFLYPFRFRIADEDFAQVKTGDFCIVNLPRAGLYFSFGPRFCSGAKLFQEISQKYLDLLSQHDIRLLNPDQIIERTGNRDLPFMTSTHQARLCPYSQLKSAFNKPEEK